MKAKPLKLIDGVWQECPVAEATHVTIHLPGLTGQLTLPIILRGTREGTHCWTWNGDTEKPTLKPSVLVSAGHFSAHFKPEEDTCWCKYYKENPKETQYFHCFRCHTWINDGQAQFLADSTHAHAGQTLALLDL